MSESFSEGGNQARRPPSPDQYRTIHGLIRTLSPDSKTWRYLDDGGVEHVVLIKNYENTPHAEDPNMVGFVNHVDRRKAFAPTLYYLESDPLAAAEEDLHLRVEVFDRSDVRGGLAERAARLIQKLRRAEIATELGADAANAAQAQGLIDVLSAVAERGVPRG